MTQDGVRARYRSVEGEAEEAAERLEGRTARVSRVRVAAFLLFAISLLLLEVVDRRFWPYLFGASGVGLVLFLLLVARHRRLNHALRRAKLRAKIAGESVARLERRWDDFPRSQLGTAPRDHPSAADLDLVGRASLGHLLGRVSTAPGKAFQRLMILDPFARFPAEGTELLPILKGQLGAPSATPPPRWSERIGARQNAVRALASEAGFREELELHGREVEGRGELRDTERFLQWLDEPRWLANRRGLVLAARTLGIFTPATSVTWILGWTPGILPVLGALLSLAIYRSVAPHATRGLDAAEAGEGDIASWTALFALAEDGPEGSPLLARLRAGFREPSPGARRAFRKLLTITQTAGVRRSSLAHFPLVALFSWDVHMLDWLERWQLAYGGAAGRWIRNLGEIEALASLAGLYHDHPDWTLPAFSEDDASGIQGTRLGHPLLDPGYCVRNDVEVPGPGQLLLVTGSNMAGKTTLLRAIGVNQILALMGGPVAAESLRTRALLPWTAMRTADSLEEGVSFFLAELRRLKRVVDAAGATPTLFLLDEILQGTNSAERLIAARLVLERLLDTPSVGAITTHDLMLADSESLNDRAVDVHFREEVLQGKDGRKLSFDYRLRPGPATSRNALLLLEMVGLAEAPEEEVE